MAKNGIIAYEALPKQEGRLVTFQRRHDFIGVTAAAAVLVP